MKSYEILWLILLVIVLAFDISYTLWTNANSLPHGKRAVKKFIEKINIIKNVTEDNEQPVEFVHKGKHFKVMVLVEDKQTGLEYSTIPRYISKMLYINNEPVCRIHDLEDYSKHRTYLEFGQSRERAEIIELVEFISIASPV